MNAMPRALASLASQRVAGRGALVTRLVDGRTRIAELYQDGAAKLRVPRHDRPGLEAVLINTAGGLTGGDRLGWEIRAGAGADVTVTTQACEKIYRAAEDRAEVRCDISVGDGGRIAWLPQETILYEGSALTRGLAVDLAAGGQVLLAEAVIVGRKAHGETVRRASLKDRWRVRAEGRLVHAEYLSLGPEMAGHLAARAGASGGSAFATVMLVAPDAEAFLGPAREILGSAGGASFWQVGATGKLLARLVAEDGYALRRRLVPLLGLLNRGAELPKLWSL